MRNKTNGPYLQTSQAHLRRCRKKHSLIHTVNIILIYIIYIIYIMHRCSIFRRISTLCMHACPQHSFSISTNKNPFLGTQTHTQTPTSICNLNAKQKNVVVPLHHLLRLFIATRRIYLCTHIICVYECVCFYRSTMRGSQTKLFRE